jgi:hypothetical protein
MFKADDTGYGTICQRHILQLTGAVCTDFNAVKLIQPPVSGTGSQSLRPTMMQETMPDL